MSYTPVQMFIEWLGSYSNLNGYSLSRGMWDEDNSDMKKKFLSVWVNQGRNPGPGISYPSIRVIVTGVRNGRAIGDAESVEMFAHGIIDSANENWDTDCITLVRPLGSIQGPNYTTNNRAWYEVNFQLII